VSYLACIQTFFSPPGSCWLPLTWQWAVGVHVKKMIASRLDIVSFVGFDLNNCDFSGRIAEELIYGAEHVTTGASNDLQQAARTANAMVC
jgi:hypothetical protein